MMFWTWVRSVFGAMNSCSQISGVDRPSVSARRTSSSRGVSGSTIRRSSPRSRAAATRRAISTITERGRSVSPACAARTACDDVLGGPILGQVAVGAGLDRLEDGLVVGQGRDHDDPGGRPAGLDRARRLGAGAVGQAVVHEDDVEPLAGHRLGVGDGAGDADDLDVGLPSEHRGQGVGQQLVVLDEEDPDPLRLRAHGCPPPVSIADASLHRDRSAEDTSVGAAG